MIVVTGATGTIGRALIEELGGAVRAVVRRPEQGRELGCDYVVGDLERPESIPLEPGDRLFLNSALWPGFVQAHQAVIDDASTAGTAQVVTVSVRGVTSSNLLGFGMHGQVDEHLKAWAAALLTRPVAADATYELTGPMGPTHDEVAAELTRALGRTVRYVDLSVEEAAVHLERRGMPAPAARDAAELMSQVGDGRWASTTTTVADILGRQPLSLREFLGHGLS